MKGDIFRKKKMVDYFTPYTEIKPRWIKDLNNMKTETIKGWEELGKISKNSLREDFFN